MNYRNKRLWLGALGLVGLAMLGFAFVPPFTPPLLVVGILLMLPGLAYLALLGLFRVYLWTR